VRLSGTSYVKAQADSVANAEVVGIVSATAGADHFTLTTSGLITGLAGLTASTVYFLSDSTPGLLTATEPTAIGSVSKPVLIADSTTSGYLFNFRGSVISGRVAFIEPTTATAEAIVLGLVAAGLMTAGFLDPPSATPEAICNALIAAGLMEAS
jgi:hypothetical protein